MSHKKNPFLADGALLRIPDLAITPNFDLSRKTSMQTRATAAVLAEPKSFAALQDLVLLADARRWPLLLLGGGKNMIFAEAYFEGIVVILPKNPFGLVESLEPNILSVGAQVQLPQLIRSAKQLGLMGLEFLNMVPGTVGGSIAGNAGAGDWGLCDFVERVIVMDRKTGDIFRLHRGEFKYGYRFSELSQVIVLQADLLLPSLDEAKYEREMESFKKKKDGQPYDKANCGCVFKNPWDPGQQKKISAGMLIDQCGMKGYTLNGVQVSERHANFLLNIQEASGEDFLAMINTIRDTVAESTGFELEMEARVVGGPLTTCVLYS